MNPQLVQLLVQLLLGGQNPQSSTESGLLGGSEATIQTAPQGIAGSGLSALFMPQTLGLPSTEMQNVDAMRKPGAESYNVQGSPRLDAILQLLMQAMTLGKGQNGPTGQ